MQLAEISLIRHTGLVISPEGPHFEVAEVQKGSECRHYDLQAEWQYLRAPHRILLSGKCDNLWSIAHGSTCKGDCFGRQPGVAPEKRLLASAGGGQLTTRYIQNVLLFRTIRTLKVIPGMSAPLDTSPLLSSLTIKATTLLSRLATFHPFKLRPCLSGTSYVHCN